MIERAPKTFFPGQQADEEVCLITRRHWIVFTKEFVVWLLFASLLIFLDAYLLKRFPLLGEAPYFQILALLRTVYLMLLLTALFLLWILYYLNYQIITNERVVDVDQKNLLHHSFSEVHLGRIQDVTAEIKGVLGTFFNYGHVYIQTAGEQARFEFDHVPNPHQVAKLILDLYEKLPQEQKIPKP